MGLGYVVWKWIMIFSILKKINWNHVRVIFFGSCWKLLKDSILAKCKLTVYPTNAQIFWCFKRPVRCLLPNLSFHGRVGAPATDRADHCLSVKRGPRPWCQKCIGVWPPTCSSFIYSSFIVFLFWELACILPVVTILVKILFILWRDIIKICAYNK